MLGMAVFLPIEDVAAATDLMFLLLFLQVNLAAVRIRRRWGNELDYGFRTPFFPFVPYAGALSQIVLAVFLLFYSPLAWLSALLWVGVGVSLFYLWVRPRMRISSFRARDASAGWSGGSWGCPWPVFSTGSRLP